MKFSDEKLLEKRRLHEEWLGSRKKSGEGFDLGGATLLDVDLSGWNLEAAILADSTLQQVRFIKEKLISLRPSLTVQPLWELTCRMLLW